MEVKTRDRKPKLRAQTIWPIAASGQLVFHEAAHLVNSSVFHSKTTKDESFRCMKKQNGLYICTYFPTVGVNSHRSSSPVALETNRHKTKISNSI